MFHQTNILQLKDAISNAQTLGIVVSENPDLDTMAAALSLYLSLSQYGKNVSVCSKTEPIVAISSLVGIDKVSKTLTGGNDLTIALPYQQGTIEKISYNIDGDKINLVIKGGVQGLQFDSSEVQFLRTGGTPDLLFAIGITDASELSEFGATDGKVVIINLDNKAQNQQFGQIVLIDTSASSVSELTGHIISQLALPMDVDIAQNLLSGIAFATDNFQNPNTSPLAFEIVGLLMKLGARRQDNFMKQTVAGGPDFDVQNMQSKQRVEKTKKITELPQPVEEQGAPPADWLRPKIYKGSSLV